MRSGFLAIHLEDNLDSTKDLVRSTGFPWDVGLGPKSGPGRTPVFGPSWRAKQNPRLPDSQAKDSPAGVRQSCRRAVVKCTSRGWARLWVEIWINGEGTFYLKRRLGGLAGHESDLASSPDFGTVAHSVGATQRPGTAGRTLTGKTGLPGRPVPKILAQAISHYPPTST